MSHSTVASPVNLFRFSPTVQRDGSAIRLNPLAVQWDEVALRRSIKKNLGRTQVIVVSDRQPVSHEWVCGVVQPTHPASGLVTAVEPILRACEGTWIAHGSGSADHEAVDSADVWHAPPERGSYRLRRIWLTPNEELGYRHGFANSGLWPLCHLVQVRPTFEEADWEHYKQVNLRFAEAVVSEARQPDPLVLIQDYHLALVPALLRNRLPRATIVVFWHIPWTPSEQMGICPWLPELMEGLLGSDVVGFQTDQHSRNFLATAERCGLKLRSSARHSIVGPAGRPTLIRDYPISVAWPCSPEMASSSPEERPAAAGRQPTKFPAGSKLIVGVDRFDYTKGLLERLRAIEHLLENHPCWQGRLQLMQVASPSRMALAEYGSFRKRVFSEVSRINQRFARNGVEPISLLDRHHDRSAVEALYRAADVCLVTSLHDGMNLVSKEFVAARDDEHGVLILSEFAGAAQELDDALIVNPYHTAQVSEAIHRALTMPEAEQRQRMKALRATVRSRNVYRWAATLLDDAAQMRSHSMQAHSMVALG